MGYKLAKGISIKKVSNIIFWAESEGQEGINSESEEKYLSLITKALLLVTPISHLSSKLTYVFSPLGHIHMPQSFSN